MRLVLFFFLVLSFFSCTNTNSSNQDNIENQEELEKEQLRLENLNHYLAISDSLYESDQKTKAITFLDTAISYALKETGQLNFRKANYLYALKAYVEAGEYYQISIDRDFKKDTSYYQRALCFEKIRDRQSAVNELKEAIKFGHREADKLHERINPERKRVSGYNIRCCDGSISYSTSRRGTCSHHGGVCNWKEPVYESYRKF